MRGTGVIRLSFSLIAAAGLFASPSASADARMGRLIVSVVDDQSRPLSCADLYIYNVHTGRIQTVPYTHASQVLHFLPGDYRLYAASRIMRGDYLDRFTSGVLHVVVDQNTNENVIFLGRHYLSKDSALPATLVRTLPADVVQVAQSSPN